MAQEFKESSRSHIRRVASDVHELRNIVATIEANLARAEYAYMNGDIEELDNLFDKVKEGIANTKACILEEMKAKRRE